MIRIGRTSRGMSSSSVWSNSVLSSRGLSRRGSNVKELSSNVLSRFALRTKGKSSFVSKRSKSSVSVNNASVKFKSRREKMKSKDSASLLKNKSKSEKYVKIRSVASESSRNRLVSESKEKLLRGKLMHQLTLGVFQHSHDKGRPPQPPLSLHHIQS